MLYHAEIKAVRDRFRQKTRSLECESESALSGIRTSGPQRGDKPASSARVKPAQAHEQLRGWIVTPTVNVPGEPGHVSGARLLSAQAENDNRKSVLVMPFTSVDIC